MKNLAGLIILAMIFQCPPVISQGDWELLIPQPTSNQMVSLYFIDEHTGWSVGEYGTILKTTDGGANWRLIEIPWLYDLSDIFFASAQVGYAVGTDGHIIKSADGGDNWVKQEIKFTNNLNRVRFLDGNKGWIIGEKGLILYTEDGGNNWEQQLSNSREDLLGIDFTGDTGICVVGTNKAILLTSDEGQMWEVVIYEDIRNEFIDFEDVFFPDANRGWIGGEITSPFEQLGIILQTSNGGKNWVELDIGSCEFSGLNERFSFRGMTVPIHQIYFKNDLATGIFLSKMSKETYFINVSNLPFNTTNGGKDWFGNINGRSEGTSRNGRFSGLADDRFINTAFQGEFRFSDNCGYSWHYLNPYKRCWEDIIMRNQGQVLCKRAIEDEQCEYLMTTNFGDTWEKFTPQLFDSSGNSMDISYRNFLNSFFNYHDTLWAISQQSIFNSTDFGVTWHEEHSNLQIRSTAQFITPDTLIDYYLSYVEVTPDVRKPMLVFSFSYDGGRTQKTLNFMDVWNDISETDDIPLMSGKAINDSYFFNGLTGFLIGYDGNIIKTSNGGLTWQAINSGVVENLWDIEFISHHIGFIVGDFGRILKTEDGGNTWRKTDSGTQQNIYSIGFKNEQEGWVGTENGLRHTTNGGESWRGVLMRYQHGLIRRIFIDDDGNGYAYSIPGDLSLSYYTHFMWIDRNGDYVFFLRMKADQTQIDPQLANVNLPVAYCLEQNYPNPFNASTRIQYQLPAEGHISLKIFNIQGQLIKTMNDEIQTAGQHSVVWKGHSDSGETVASGIYVYQLASKDFVKTRKMLLIK